MKRTVNAGHQTLCFLAAAMLTALPPTARAATVSFESAPNSPAVQAAVPALGKLDPTTSYPLTDVSAAFVHLSPDGRPELFIKLTGGFCGATGNCDYILLEPGTQGWVKVGH